MPETAALTVPTVHLNGTSKTELTIHLELASDALRVAIEATQETAPDARDYYVQGPQVTLSAIREHRSRLDRLNSVRQELTTLWEAILDQ